MWPCWRTVVFVWFHRRVSPSLLPQFTQALLYSCFIFAQFSLSSFDARLWQIKPGITSVTETSRCSYLPCFSIHHPFCVLKCLTWRGSVPVISYPNRTTSFLRKSICIGWPLFAYNTVKAVPNFPLQNFTPFDLRWIS